MVAGFLCVRKEMEGEEPMPQGQPALLRCWQWWGRRESLLGHGMSWAWSNSSNSVKQMEWWSTSQNSGHDSSFQLVFPWHACSRVFCVRLCCRLCVLLLSYVDSCFSVWSDVPSFSPPSATSGGLSQVSLKRAMFPLASAGGPSLSSTTRIQSARALTRPFGQTSVR